MHKRKKLLQFGKVGLFDKSAVQSLVHLIKQSRKAGLNMQIVKLRATWPFQALSDETRFRVVRLLASTDESIMASGISAALQVVPSHLSRHLQVLHAAGIVQVERKGLYHHIKIDSAAKCNHSLYAAVLSMEDDAGVFAGDLARLFSNQVQKTLPPDYDVGSGSELTLGSDGVCDR